MVMLYIWIRATVDWQDEEAFLAQLRPELEPKISVWNETFNIPFHGFRHRIREIARLSMSRVQNAVCVDWDDIPEGGLVAPADDDDWFAPEVGTVLESEREPGTTGCYWTSSTIEVPIHFPHRLGLIRRRIFPGTPPRWICTTNNYAMVKSPESKAFLGSHMLASKSVKDEQTGPLTRIERRLSVANRTLASQTSLAWEKPSISRSQLIRKFERYRKLYDRPTLPGLAWCQPYLAMMSDLMAELRVKDRR
jgi:hypothetical protein